MNGLVLRVRTRSKVLDYRFVGTAAQPERWWEKPYGRWTDFSRPTILVEPGRFFVSGISSRRRTDSKGARIHYALLAEVTREGCVLAAQVLAWLCEVRQRTGSLEEVGERLDALDEEAWSAAVQGDPAAVHRIEAAVIDLARQNAHALEPVLAPRRFPLAAEDPRAFVQLAAVAAEVVALEAGREECAVYLNLASSSELDQLNRCKGSAIVCRELDKPPKPSRPLLAGVAVAMLGLVLVAALLLTVTG